MTTNPSSKITSIDIFLHLRKRLLDAREKNNVEMLMEIQTVCDFLSELADLKSMQTVGAILEEFESSARDSITGVPWKSTIPSEEEIRSVFHKEGID